MKGDRIFLDANILFSVAYGSAGLHHLWELARKGSCVLLASRHVIEETKRNLSEPSHLKRLDHYLEAVHTVSEIDPTVACPLVLPEKDRPVLMAAIAAEADYLITGDVTHFGKYFGRKIMGVTICLAREYISSKMKS